MRRLALLGLLALACQESAEQPTAAQREAVTAAARALGQNRPEHVHGLLAPFLARAPVSADVQFLAGWAAYNLNDFGECVERMSAALAQDPARWPEARVLGFAHYKLGAFEQARDVFTRVVERAPAEHRAHYGLGLVELSLGNTPAARAHLERALALDPDYLKARFAWARLLEEEGRDADALHAVEAVLARWPSHEDALYLQARLLSELGREQEARQALARWEAAYSTRAAVGQLQQRIRAGEDEPVLWLLQADAFLRIGDRQEAHRVLRDGLQRHPQDAALRRALEQVQGAALNEPGDDG